MELQDLQQAMKERNEATTAALECAALVLERARRLPPEQRLPMLELVRAEIARVLSVMPVMIDNRFLN